jgi:hypothetical protein
MAHFQIHRLRGPYLREKIVNCYIWSFALYDAETLTLRKVDRKYLESF